jgi:hypothetical protein
MARCSYDHLLDNNIHYLIEYAPTIDDTNYLANHLYSPDTVSYVSPDIRQTPCDRVRSWITSRCFTYWSYCVFRVAITET